ncbi:MAG: protein-glutamate O-methyltransferase CheR [Candidatus Zixiibacteriota bacterium]|nr:MAG: protein-glutamate O-methyltransferase CheR [candidate division Zixibacteria bacterium]
MATGFESDLEMSVEDFTTFRDYVHEKSGIYFAENKMYLVKNRLQKRMAELDMKTVRDYFYHVKYDTSLKEFNHLMTLITTNETSFFRNEPQLKSFSDEVLLKMIEEKQKAGKSRSLKIWSAGCSTGEEPYTLGMMILEKLKGLTGWKTEIIASDISEAVLQKARRGEYAGITLRNVSPDMLNKYYTKNGDLYQIKPEVKSLVKFSHLNLNDTRKMAMMNNMDVIFCRNVMIYFSEEVKKQLVRGFFNALKPGGYYYIGHSETLHGLSKAFKLVYFKNALVYHKEVGAAGTETKTKTSTFSRPAKTATASPGAASGASRALDLLAKIKKPTVGVK